MRVDGGFCVPQANTSLRNFLKSQGYVERPIGGKPPHVSLIAPDKAKHPLGVNPEEFHDRQATELKKYWSQTH